LRKKKRISPKKLWRKQRLRERLRLGNWIRRT
jgi:hypothetical protein